jgi:hypothetical protein
MGLDERPCTTENLRLAIDPGLETAHRAAEFQRAAMQRAYAYLLSVEREQSAGPTICWRAGCRRTAAGRLDGAVASGGDGCARRGALRKKRPLRRAASADRNWLFYWESGGYDGGLLNVEGVAVQRQIRVTVGQEADATGCTNRFPRR